MTTEYTQLLSTAHRVLDGTKKMVLSDAGCRIARYILPDVREDKMMLVTHINHPCNVWVRQSSTNYNFLLHLALELGNEYTYRYGRQHAAIARLIDSGCLSLPTNIKMTNDQVDFTKFPQTMPDEYRVPGDPVAAYRKFYNGGKSKFATWVGRENQRQVPYWYNPTNEMNIK